MSKLLFETPWFAIEEVPTRPEWNMGDKPFYQIICHDHVLVIPVMPDGRLLMVSQFRPAQGGLTQEFPAGGVDGRETPLAAAQRELLEETGHIADEWISLGSSGTANHREAAKCHVFAAFGLRHDGREKEAGIEPVLVTATQIRDNILNNSMDMLVTVGALFFAKTKLGTRLPDFW